MAHHKRHKSPRHRGHGACCEGHKGYKKGGYGEAVRLPHADRRRAEKSRDSE